MSSRELHDGRTDGLVPLQSLDVSQAQTFSDLVRAMGKTAFGGRQLGAALDVVLAMDRDEGCAVVLTLSGAMTVAKQGRIICDLIEHGVVDTVVATGALVAHGVTESIGLAHYAANLSVDDSSLFEKGYNRVYDTIEMESNLNDVAELVAGVLAETKPEDGVWCSSRFCRAVGEKLDQLDQGPGILRSAWRKGVPVFIPAFTDSEMGLDFSTHVMAKAMALSHRAADAAPRNWAQQVGPYYDITAARLGLKLPQPRFQYGVHICPEPVHWGGLSGCTYSEGVSWGKFVPPEKGGRYAEVHADATLVLPLLVKAVFELLSGD